MTHIEAWHWITEHWSGGTWRPVPANVRIILSLPEGLGMCSGMLITRTAALGIMEFVNRLNHRKDS